MSIEKAVERIRSFRRAMNFSVLGFAKEAKVSETSVRGIDTKDWNPTLATLMEMDKVVPKNFNVK